MSFNLITTVAEQIDHSSLLVTRCVLINKFIVISPKLSCNNLRARLGKTYTEEMEKNPRSMTNTPDVWCEDNL